MKNTHVLRLSLLAASVFGAAAHCAAAAYTFNVDTSALVGLPGAFSLDFQFTDGSGTGDANNTVTLGGFTFGGGSWTGPTTKTLTDNAFFVDFAQGFTPGSQIHLNISMTTAVDPGGTPDLLSLAILHNGVEIPTLATAGFDTLLLINIDSANPTVQTFGTDPGRTAIGILPPTVSSVPDGSLPLVLLGGIWSAGLFACRRWKLV